VPEAIEKPKKKAASEEKRRLILEAARRVFEREGLEGASLRSIAGEAGYTPAALYFHFDSREEIYAELLASSLESLKVFVDQSLKDGTTARERFEKAAFAFFDYYDKTPDDLALGLYLFRGGISPKSVGRDRNKELNAALSTCLEPIAEAALSLGATDKQAKDMKARVFAHATGVLLLSHTGRIRMFECTAPQMMRDYITEQLTLQKWN